jgi:hypothetical protein
VKDNSNQASYDYDVLKEHKLKPYHGRKKFGKVWWREERKRAWEMREGGEKTFTKN